MGRCHSWILCCYGVTPCGCIATAVVWELLYTRSTPVLQICSLAIMRKVTNIHNKWTETWTCVCVDTQTHTHTHTHTYMYTHTRTRTNVYTHVNKHNHTQVHTHPLIFLYRNASWFHALHNHSTHINNLNIKASTLHKPSNCNKLMLMWD